MIDWLQSISAWASHVQGAGIPLSVADELTLETLAVRLRQSGTVIRDAETGGVVRACNLSGCRRPASAHGNIESLGGFAPGRNTRATIADSATRSSQGRIESR